MTNGPLPSPEDVKDAATRIHGIACHTPLLENDVLNEKLGARIFLKPEVLQRTGSFKFRGAYNRLSRLEAKDRKAGVVAWSSGNHAQGVAAAARLLDMPVLIVMPKDAPKLKLERTRALGAEVHLYDRYTEDREIIGRALAEERGAALVPSYDDPHIIAGQGTAAAEIFTDLPVAVEQILVPCGGGGLTAGTVLARDLLAPQTDVLTVEPENFDDHARSFLSGQRERIDPAARNICDALLTPQPGKMTFEINRRGVREGCVVSETEVAAAVRFAFEHLKLVVEPGGAVGLAALLAGQASYGRNTALILSGGNVDPDLFIQLIS